MLRFNSVQKLHRALRVVVARTTNTLLDSLGRRLHTSPERDRALYEELLNSPAFVHWAVELARKTISERYGEFINTDQADDLALESVMQMLAAKSREDGNTPTLLRSLERFDRDQGAPTLSKWLGGLVKQQALWKAKAHLDKQFQHRGDDGYNSPLARIDDEIGGKVKYHASPEAMFSTMPEKRNYLEYAIRQFNPEMTYEEHMDFLQSLEQELERSSIPGAQKRKLWHDIQDQKSEISTRHQFERGIPTPAASPMSPPVSPPAIPKDIKDTIRMRRHWEQRENDHAESFDERINRMQSYYANAPKFLMDNAALTGNLQKLYKTKGGPLSLNSQVMKNDGLPADLSRAVSEAVLQTLIRVKLIENASLGKTKHVDHSLGVVKKGMGQFFISELTKALQARNLPESVIDSVVTTWAQRIGREFQYRVGEADELMRHYTYHQLKNELAPDTPWSDLTDEQVKQIAMQAHQSMGYKDGAHMYARKTTDPYKLSPWKQRDETAEQQFMAQEAGKWRNPAGLGVSFMGTLDPSMGYFGGNKGDFREIDAAAESVRIVLAHAMELADLCDRAGCAPAADRLSASVTTLTRLG